MSFRAKFSQVLDKYYSAEWTKKEALDELERYFLRHLPYRSPPYKKASLDMTFPNEETIKAADGWLKGKEDV